MQRSIRESPFSAKLSTLAVIHEEGKEGRTATVAFATKSPSELPIAKIVRPKMASESPKMCPMVLRRWKSKSMRTRIR